MFQLQHDDFVGLTRRNGTNYTGNDANEEAVQSATTATFITSLATNFVIAGIELLGWVLLRGLIKAVYEPRTYIPPHDDQAKPLGRNLLKPIWRIIMADEEEILRKNGVDPYVFVRFLRMMCIALIPVWILSWIILMPLNRVGASTADGSSGLDLFTFGSVTDKHRYWAHCILCWVFDGWLMFLVWREMAHWVVVRQRHLVSPKHSSLAQASTVLITGIPKHYMDEQQLTKLFSYLPGGVKRVWLSRDLKKMPEYYDRRNKACKKLEAAEVALLKAAHKHKTQTEKKIAELEKKGKPVPDELRGYANPPEEGKPMSRADQLVPRAMRPTMRLKHKRSPVGLGFLGVGEKVDTIEWCRQEIVETKNELANARKMLADDVASHTDAEDNYRPLSSAFILFHQQIAAHMARQCLTYNQPYMMNNRYIEQAPQNVIWSSLGLRNQYEKNLRMAASYGITIGMIIFWALPVTFIGSLSSVTSLTNTFPWLRWILGDSFGKKLLQGVISGILPPVLLALLMMLLPIIFRKLSAFQGTVSHTEVELDVMTRYFVFLVVHSFILITLSSGLIQALGTFAKDTTAIATTLATQLPKASTFFLTLILTQFTGTMGTLLMPVTLVLYIVKVILGGGTPRKIFGSRYTMPSPNWGTDFPGFTIYAVIMIAYMVISPIINGLGAAFSIATYLVYKYIYIWVSQQPVAEDTGGLFFPKAITHVFVGLYLQELCLMALFFLKKALPEAIIIIVLLVATIGVQYMINHAYGPLKNSLPISLAHLSYGMPNDEGHRNSLGDESEQKKVASGSATPNDNEGSDSRRASSSPTALGDEKSKSVITSPPMAPIPNPECPTVPNVHCEAPDSPGLPEEKGHWTTGHLADVQEQFRLREKWEHTRSSVHSHSRRASLVGGLTPPHHGEDGKLNIEMAELGKAHANGSEAESSSDDDEADDKGYFALPGGPGVIKPELDENDDPDAFFAPATKEPQPVIWIPEDPYGLAATEVAANMALEIQSTYRDAYMDNKGRIKITGPPPDDSWYGSSGRPKRLVSMPAFM